MTNRISDINKIKKINHQIFISSKKNKVFF